ncbi:hypothetical protein PoB_007070800 [Plakobranchus ocellatus]|uniref:Uncharacterized protein n=1 Tax=Plakobranchus ocellatus TaxID=259542 RepID=A0AAV4DJ00_9GAST|nr:hypothetical protein PoB_007070800 [Plakobranchus ocellatus]
MIMSHPAPSSLTLPHASLQQGDLRLSGNPPGRGDGGGARTLDGGIPLNLRADSLDTVTLASFSMEGVFRLEFTASAFTSHTKTVNMDLPYETMNGELSVRCFMHYEKLRFGSRDNIITIGDGKVHRPDASIPRKKWSSVDFKTHKITPLIQRRLTDDTRIDG